MLCPYCHCCSRCDLEFCSNYGYEGCSQYMIFSIVDRHFREADTEDHAILRILDDLLTLYYDVALTIMWIKKKRENRRRFEEPLLDFNAELGLRNFIKVFEYG